jgi:hypothetical protein
MHIFPIPTTDIQHTNHQCPPFLSAVVSQLLLNSREKNAYSAFYFPTPRPIHNKLRHLFKYLRDGQQGKECIQRTLLSHSTLYTEQIATSPQVPAWWDGKACQCRKLRFLDLTLSVTTRLALHIKGPTVSPYSTHKWLDQQLKCHGYRVSTRELYLGTMDRPLSTCLPFAVWNQFIRYQYQHNLIHKTLIPLSGWSQPATDTQPVTSLGGPDKD